jgi:hypothetical protein
MVKFTVGKRVCFVKDGKGVEATFGGHSEDWDRSGRFPVKVNVSSSKLDDGQYEHGVPEAALLIPKRHGFHVRGTVCVLVSGDERQAVEGEIVEEAEGALTVF